MPVLLPDLVYHDGAFRRDHALEFGRDDGRILRVGPADELTEAAREVERLPGRALVPGFVNAHSHAFQRAIRGRTQWRPAGEADSDFWSWRDAMYAVAAGLTPEALFHVSRFCFLEMLRAGFTTVGEFHYLHRDPSGLAYDNPNELAQRVIAAAEEVGIRIVLLNVCYAAGGIGEPLSERQKRFGTPDMERFLDRTDSLRKATTQRPRVRVGVAAHSVRAVPRDWLPGIRAWANRHAAALHMHVSEQVAEVEACVAAHGLRPVELLHEDGLLDGPFTAVHATHLTDEEVSLLGGAEAVICACPTTERDLGDGFLRGRDLLDGGASIALGTDSQTLIDAFAEMRLVEYHERLVRQRRNVIVGAAGDRQESAGPLLRMATRSGSASLGLQVGRLEQGAQADLVAADLTHPSLAGWDDDSLTASMVFSGTPSLITDVWVGGVRRVKDGHHALDGVAAMAFRNEVERLLA